MHETPLPNGMPVHFDAPADMLKQCVVCTSADVVTYTMRCQYRPRAKDARRGEEAGDATITIPLCREHEGAADGVTLRGWDWWDILDSL